MSLEEKDAEIMQLRSQVSTLQNRTKELETGTARLSVRLSGAYPAGAPTPRRPYFSSPFGGAAPLQKWGRPCSLAPPLKVLRRPTMIPPLVVRTLQARLSGGRIQEGCNRVHQYRSRRHCSADAPHSMWLLCAVRGFLRRRRAATGEAVELLQSMMMAHSQSLAKFEKKMDERTSTAEMMLMQAAMSSAKQTSEMNSAIQRLESMAMTNATTMAKFQRSQDEKLEGILEEIAQNSLLEPPAPAPAAVPEAVPPSTTRALTAVSDDVADAIARLESMSMQHATTMAKFEKKLSERTESIESMAMQASMTHAKESSQSKDQLERLEGMGMTNATTVAKFQRGVNEKFEEILQVRRVPNPPRCISIHGPYRAGG
jgi:hypothetical protein